MEFAAGATPRDSTPDVAPGPARVLFVDLDGTILKTDLLWESFFAALKSDPRLLFQVPSWLFKGRAQLKSELAARGPVDVRGLPYREEVLEFLKLERATGCRVVLATAAARTIAAEVAAELQLFDDVLATEGAVNLKGPAKLAAIQCYCTANGYESFGYLGDGPADIPIWQNADRAYSVSPSKRLRKSLAASHPRAEFMHQPTRLWKDALRLLRPKQWAKNLLIFVPLLMSHQILNSAKLGAACLAFVAFSLCASGIYVLNDLMDMAADRGHPTKRRRPFAAGDVPVQHGIPLSAGLIAAGFAVAAFLPAAFVFVLILYLLATCAYTYWAKGVVALDVVLLAGFYAIRVIGGGVATGVEVSQWLIAFSMFLFLSLAFAKRCSELLNLQSAGRSEAKGRAYRVDDLGLIQNLGPTSGYLSVLVLALYVNSGMMEQVYANPWPLWAICPLLLYWISRLWFLAARGELSEDPVAFALTDRVSLGVGVATMLLLAAATFIPKDFSLFGS